MGGDALGWEGAWRKVMAAYRRMVILLDHLRT